METFIELKAKGIRQAIVSNSNRLIVDANLRAIGLIESELTTVSRNDVRSGKPHPESYQRAAWLLNQRPAQLTVVEDSPTGVAAGLAAGIRTLYWPQAGGQLPPLGSTLVNTVDELRSLLQLYDAP